MDYVFDLDGTLIDSAPAIRHCLQAATRAVAPEYAGRAAQVAIGPPLPRMAEWILGELHVQRGAEFVEVFKRLYDTEGTARTRGFEGATTALRALHAGPSRLAIVTNKRENPTKQILASLGWTSWFFAVLCIDSPGHEGQDKPARLATLLPQLDAHACAFVGDTLEDYQAAASSGLPFIAADYGYELERDAFLRLPTLLRLTTAQDLGRLSTLRPAAMSGGTTD